MSDAFGLPRTALVLGGGSDIGRAVVDRLAREGLEHVALAGRDEGHLDTVAERFRATGMRAVVLRWDARDAADHAGLMGRASAVLGDVDVVVCTVGKLGHGAGSAVSPPAVWDLFADNASGPVSALTAAAQHLVGQGHGCIVVISSVAALRPRRSNYVYGAAKAGLDAFARGLADAHAGTPVRVHLIRPGFVRTKMTTGLEEAPFTVDADAVAEAVAGVVRSRRDRVVHVPAILGPMFVVLRCLPTPLWRRLAGDR